MSSAPPGPAHCTLAPACPPYLAGVGQEEHGPENQTGLGGKARSARLPGLWEEVLSLPMLGWRQQTPGL